ncbi:hypothetical protein ACFOD0_12965 [Shewanella intestini]|uniref:DUF3098 domain-containing protein n=1 Tax=Shewanella intestini TaxID=2017544 RepID=A0ABS5I1Y2_9GAMM|nr:MULTISPECIES: hypothetical protein [Shewanella]MBR9727370.1 hypothetical protein [Shewanella intestini]MRG35580.1 hypothetical protein [Shewanella sp. XMDDZSB0408]
MSEQTQSQARLKEVEKKVKLLKLIEAPAMIVIGLGIYAMFSANPAALHPILADSTIVNGALAVAVPWAAFCMFKSVKLSIEKRKLKQSLS